MIRRLFWLTAGAVLGIAGYRRAVAMSRAVSAWLAAPADAEPLPAGQRGEVGPRDRTTGRAAARIRGAVRFARDVGEGMEVYMERHRGRLGPRLGQVTTGRQGGRVTHVKDGR